MRSAGCPVAGFEEMMQALLPSVTIDDQDLHAAMRQRHRAVKSECGFADAAFLVGEGDDVRGGAPPALKIL